MTTQTLQIKGMTCGACVARVENALKSVPGVDQCAVNLATNLATVSADAPPSALIDAVQKAGYDAVPVTSGAGTLKAVAAEQQEHVAAVRRRLVLGFLFSIPVLLIDLAHNRLLEIHSDQGLIALALAELLFASLVVFYTGRPFFTGAARALRHFSANMDVLVALGSGVAYGYSLILSILRILELTQPALFAPHHALPHGEYHAAATIIVLVTLGKYLEARAKRAANTAVAALATESAATATRITGDNLTETVPADSIAVGDRIQVTAHQTVPVDGVLIEGAGSLDQSVLTGESVPVELSAQTPVPAGARLLDGRIVLRATATAAHSTVARILSLVQEAQASKTAIQGLADRVAAVFVPIVLVLGLVTLAGWLLAGHPLAHALLPTIATIVIACPCAMGLATPTALTVAIGRAARNGILFTQASALETAARGSGRGARGITTVLFDKTGTLTRGEFELIETLNTSAPSAPSALPTPPAPSTPPDQAQGLQSLGLRAPPSPLQLAASVEQFSDHPLAKALVKAALAQKLPLLDPDSFSSVPGGGVEAELPARTLIAGSLAFMTSRNINLAPHQPEIARLHAAGLTLVALAEIAPTPRLLALFALRDALRPDAAETIAALRAQGIKVGVISGDTEAAVRGTFANIALDLCLANVKPEDKAATIAKLSSPAPSSPTHRRPATHASIAFVGDGVNDAPALAAADLGITLASGTDLAKTSADVILLSPRLMAIPETLTLARRTLRVIKQNLVWAFGYNVAAIPLAMLGILPPSVAAGAMILSSLSVVGNALRLYR